MAKKVDTKTQAKKNPTRHKIIVEQGRAMGSPFVPYKVLHTEIAPDRESAKVRVEELRKEYEGTDALSLNYFSL